MATATATPSTLPINISLKGNDLFDTLQTDEPYWANYLLARPNYSPSFYTLIQKYRAAAAKSPSAFELAHDVGTGPGQVARVLANTQFAKVIASDASPAHVDVAGRLNRDLVEAGKLSLRSATGETLADDVELHGKADAILCAEAIPLMDATKAVGGWAKLLKSGGITATWFYGRPYFVDSADFDAKRANDVYAQIVNRLFGPMIAGLAGEKEKKGWERATAAMHSWLDNIAFPADTWENVQRHKWNTSRTMDFYDIDVCGVDVSPVSAVGKDEKVFEQEDDSFWGTSWTVTEVRRFIEVNLPKFWEGRGKDEALEALYQELEDVIGGPGAKRQIGWPVVVVLATKK